MADEKHAGSMQLNHNKDLTRDPDALAPQGAVQGANPVADGYLAHLQKTWGAKNRLIAAGRGAAAGRRGARAAAGPVEERGRRQRGGPPLIERRADPNTRCKHHREIQVPNTTQETCATAKRV
jgi:hypothetical protein